MQICRAELGKVFQVNANLYDIQRRGGLKKFLHEVTGVDTTSIISFLSDGKQLREDNLRELAGAADQSIFVFNRDYLDADVEEVIAELTLQPVLQPVVEDASLAGPPHLLESYLYAANLHHDFTANTLSTLHFQHEAMRIASTNLDLHVLSLTDGFDAFAEQASRELDRQAQLLRGKDTDLRVIAKVNVHPEFLSANTRKGIEAGGKGRTLGDYVLPERMKVVAETCLKLHDELNVRFQNVKQSLSQLVAGAEEVRFYKTSSLLEESEMCTKRSLDYLERLTSLASSWNETMPNQKEIFAAISDLDAALRREVLEITTIRNQSTRRCLEMLRKVSQLQSDIVSLPSVLTGLEADLRLKTGFPHLQRLHQMFYVYGATVVEVVRRKEFARFFMQRAQTIAEIMAKLTSNERKRRQVYRGEVHGQLPFETRGMDEPAPTLEISTTGGGDSYYSLEREDFPTLFQVMDEIEKEDPPTDGSAHPISETRAALEKLISRMDSLESDFDRMAERSILSASRIAHHKRRTTSDASTHQEIMEQLRELQQAKAEQENDFQVEKTQLEAEISRLRTAFEAAESGRTSEQERADKLELDLHSLRGQSESDITARRVLEQRHAELQVEVEKQRQALSEALAEATEQTHKAEILRHELMQAKVESEEVRALQERNAERVATLLSDQAATLKNLEEARQRGEDLEIQIRTARAEGEQANIALKEAALEKERLLRVQASEADRLLRDHIAEADGDRAVLEHQFSELKATLDSMERQLKDSKAAIDVLQADASGLREEVQRVNHENRDLKHHGLALREQITASMAIAADAEGRLERSEHFLAGVLEVAIAFRDSHHKALVAMQNMLRASSGARSGTLGIAESTTLPLPAESHERPLSPTPIDATDHANALDILREFDLDAFAETVAKIGSTIRKWRKQCGEYRERAKGKISFRNFAKGDLALFLPTRNSIAKPWAAFNVSFPHYFLQATGHVAEQLKTREWIVARITSIAERVVDPQDPQSNPYGLGNGVKYFLLEVEDWTQSGGSAGRSSVRPRVTSSSGRRGGESQPFHLRSASTPQATTSLSPARAISPPPQLLPVPPLTSNTADPDITEAITASPTSRLFPTRIRTSSGTAAGPSSLSKLLAQAPNTTATLSPTAPNSTSINSPSRTGRRPSPVGAHRQPVSTTNSPKNRLLQLQPQSSSPGSIVANPQHAGSSLRPASIHSSSSSRPSSSFGARMPPFAIVPSATKASSTVGFTAVPSPPSQREVDSEAEQESSALPKMQRSLEIETQELQRPASTPSPADSATDGLNSVLLGMRRQRTSSTVTPGRQPTSPLVTMSPSSPLTPTASNTGPTAGNTIASLASSWGIALGRRIRNSPTPGSSPPSAESRPSSRDPLGRVRQASGSGSTASALLRKLESGSGS